MTATYTNDPENRAIDQVRLEINDKDCEPESNAKLTDEEIAYYLATTPNALFAAAAACDGLSAQWVTEPTSKMVGDLQKAYGTVDQLGSLSKSLRRRAIAGVGTSIYAGGLSKQEKETAARQPDRVQPAFTIGMDDTQAAGEQDGTMEY